MHVVVGEIHREPPSFHVEAVIDERRFLLGLPDVAEGYERRQQHFPLKWLRRLRVVDAWEYRRLRELPASTTPAAEREADAEELADRVDPAPERRDASGPPPGGAHENGAAGA
jgi:hypothetical protein